MDNRPIGFFDSGLGGLNSVPKLMKALPKERVVYFGDTARTPYGSKDISTIKTFAVRIADFLVRSDVKMIVIACNTASATCLDMLRERYPDIPVVGIIDPAAAAVSRRCTEENHIGIIGTKVTIQSGSYRKNIEKYNSNLHIYEKACPAFVPLIEEGILNDEIMELTIRYYMDDFVEEDGLDTLVLGCTHYPLIRADIERLYPDLDIIDPSEEIIYRIEEILKENDIQADGAGAENEFYASDLSENFINMIKTIFRDEDAHVEFKNLEPDPV